MRSGRYSGLLRQRRDLSRAVQSRPKVLQVSYGIGSGIAAAALGLLISSVWSGTARILMWIAFSSPIALTLAWLSRPAIGLLGRGVLQQQGHSPNFAHELLAAPTPPDGAGQRDQEHESGDAEPS